MQELSQEERNQVHTLFETITKSSPIVVMAIYKLLEITMNQANVQLKNNG